LNSPEDEFRIVGIASRRRKITTSCRNILERLSLNSFERTLGKKFAKEIVFPPTQAMPSKL
jgi:hypothetical protein